MDGLGLSACLFLIIILFSKMRLRFEPFQTCCCRSNCEESTLLT
ncbi:hypothetical protein SSAG_02409 [Streptomyces sp. Mg1]|nr:hypothetical protein SSAG_02409 [Streptomyces sp. Mg1]